MNTIEPGPPQDEAARRFVDADADRGSAAPSAGSTAWYGLDSRSIAAGRVSALFSVAISSFGALFVTLVALVLSWPLAVKLIAIGLLWCGVVATAVTAFLAPLWRFRFTRWRVSPLGLEIRRGRWFRSELTVARSRIQHSDVAQGPVERSFGLATLSIHTAGTEHAEISLSGLAPEAARWIRAQLTGFGDDVAV